MGGKNSVVAPVHQMGVLLDGALFIRKQASFLERLIGPEIWFCFCVPTESNLITVPHDRSITRGSSSMSLCREPER
jgi:hypothetical protein